MRLSEYFEKAGTKNIVINSDIDGFLSGMILQKYYGCKVVGFSNSKESIWLSPEINSIDEPVYIDIFVNNPRTFCIDQHIVAYDENHLNRILAYGTKLNPNLNVLRKTYMGDYFHKYPFGTVHYLIALMKQDGFDVQFNQLDYDYIIDGKDGRKYTICPGQIILRADDALFSSLGNYSDNAREWWIRLKTYQSKTIDALYEYLYSTCKAERNEEYKQRIGQFFCRGLGCDGSDGAFNSITDQDKKTLQSRIVDYNNKINQIVGIKMDLPETVIEYRGYAQRSAYSENNLNRAITYAFIYGPTKPDQSFSYTVDIERREDRQ